jgi:hypothetical protein
MARKNPEQGANLSEQRGEDELRIITRCFVIVLVYSFLPLSAAVRSAIPQAPNASESLDGFTADGSAVERQWEEKFRVVPSPDSAREHLRRLTAVPHVAGTTED